MPSQYKYWECKDSALNEKRQKKEEIRNEKCEMKNLRWEMTDKKTNEKHKRTLRIESYAIFMPSQCLVSLPAGRQVVSCVLCQILLFSAIAMIS